MKNISILALVFIWVGFIISLSFIETPLKFKAPNVTLEIGLGIGKIIFSTLNTIEIFFSIVLIFLSRGLIKNKIGLFFVIVILIVVLQSIWLLPVLNERADLIISGKNPENSYHHILYIILEVVKIIALCSFGFTLGNHIIKK